MTRVLRPSLPGSEVAFTTPVCFSKKRRGGCQPCVGGRVLARCMRGLPPSRHRSHLGSPLPSAVPV